MSSSFLRLRGKVIVITLVVVVVAATGGLYIETNRPSTARASIPFVPVVKERRWNACRSYTIVFEIEADFGDSFSMRIAEVKASLKTRIPWEVFELEIISMNITLGTEIRGFSTKIMVTVHPERGVAPVGVCVTFDFVIVADIYVKYERLGTRKGQILRIESPSIPIEVCG